MSFERPNSDSAQPIMPVHDGVGGDQPLDDEILEREARRVLRQLGESGAVLAVAAAMDKAVVVREGPDGESLRTAVVDRPVAQALALKEWITCRQPGKVARYVITQAGRMALSRMQAAAENAASAAAQGLAEAPADFRGKDAVGAGMTRAAQRKRQARFSQADSPLAALARRREKDGSFFLSSDLVIAGERLREDFELAQMGPRTTQNWDHFLTGPSDGIQGPGDTLGGSSAARDRVAGALRELGPGLGDVALRCCCYLEGLEQSEKKLGWAARSGKIVLRIALQRLKRYYEGLGPGGGMIG